MIDVSDSSPSQMIREQLLNAIDSEISQRGTSLPSQGINVWGIGAAIVGLLWVAVTEAMESTHIWLHTIFVLFVGQLGLSALIGSFTSNLGKLFVLPQPASRAASFRRLLLQGGFDPKTLPDFIALSLGLFGVSLYLAFHGFSLLGTVGSLFYLVCFLILIFGWVLCHVSAPVSLSSMTTERRRGRRNVLYGFIGLFIVSTYAIAFAELGRAWPSLAKADVRLGLVLAPLLVFAGFARRFGRPPTDLNALRLLRTRLASCAF